MSAVPAASKSSDSAFLQQMLGETVPDDLALADLEEDFFAVDEDEVTGPKQFAMGDDSDDDFDAVAEGSDDDFDGEELEDAYNFDPDMVADLLKNRGCSMAELTEKFQESMAQALERRLKEKTEPPVVEDRPECTGDVDGLMTPPNETTASPIGSPDAKTVAEKLQQASQEAMARRGRRSSAVKRDAISTAMDQAVSRHRKSLVSFAATIEETGDKTQDKISQAMSQAQRRHRLSLSKAAETLDAAGFGDHDQAEVADKLTMVQKAMEEARRRHRRSIAEAVEKVTGMSPTAAEFKPSPAQMSSDATPFNPSVQDRIQQAIAEAKRRQDDNCPPGYEGYGNQNQSVEQTGAWTTPSYDQSGYTQNGYEQSGYEAACTGNSYTQPGYDQSGYDQSGYDQSGYDQSATYQKYTYEQTAPGYDQTACNQMSYDQTGCNQMSYDQTGCNQMTYGQNSYDQNMQAGNSWATAASGNQAWSSGDCYGNSQNYGGASWNQDASQGKHDACGEYYEGSAYAAGQWQQQAAWGSA